MVGLSAVILMGPGVVHSQIVILPMSVIVRLQGRLVPCLTPGSLIKLPNLQARKHRNDYPFRKLSNSPLNRNLWLLELKYDEDNAFLSDGICNGFKLVEPGTRFSDVDMDNYKSATNPVNRPMVEQTIRQEIALGNYVVSPTKPRIVTV